MFLLFASVWNKFAEQFFLFCAYAALEHCQTETFTCKLSPSTTNQSNFLMNFDSVFLQSAISDLIGRSFSVIDIPK